MNLWVRSNTYTCVVRLQNDCNNNLWLFHYYTILEDGGNYKLNKKNMLEHYTIKNTGNIFRKSVLWNGCTYWSKLLFFTCSYNCLLSHKVWGEEDFFNSHEEHFRVLYAINELLGWNYKKFLKTKCWNTGKKIKWQWKNKSLTHGLKYKLTFCSLLVIFPFPAWLGNNLWNLQNFSW